MDLPDGRAQLPDQVGPTAGELLVSVPGQWYHADTIVTMAMTLRTDDELEQALAELAEAEGVSKQEAIRRAVIEKRDRVSHRSRVDAISKEMILEWGDVLDRLGKA